MHKRHWMPLATLLTLTLGVTRAGGSEGLPPPYTLDAVRSVATGTDGQGRFVVAWVAEHAQLAEGGGEQLHAARLEGGRWRALGGVVNEKPQYNAAQPTVYPAPDGSVWLAWEEGSGDAHIDSYLMANWLGPGGWSSPSPYALRRNLSDAGRSRSFTADPANQPLVAWTDIGTGTRSAYPSVVSLKVWRGAAWQTTPYLNLDLHAPAFMPSVAQVSGQVSVAYVEGPTTRSDLWIRTWDGQAWHTLGGRVNRRARTYLFRPLLRADPRGQLFVAWLEDLDGTDTLYVSRWTGRAWQALGGPVSPAGALASSAGLAFDGAGRPVVTWTQGPDGARQVHAARWTAGRWAALGGGALNADPRADTDHSGIGAGPQGVLVAWREWQGGRWHLQTRLLR